jgi:hypothetical protein
LNLEEIHAKEMKTQCSKIMKQISDQNDASKEIIAPSLKHSFLFSNDIFTLSRKEYRNKVKTLKVRDRWEFRALLHHLVTQRRTIRDQRPIQ